MAKSGTLPFYHEYMGTPILYGERGRDSLVNLARITEITRGEDGEETFWIGFSVGEETAAVWEYASVRHRDAAFEELRAAYGHHLRDTREKVFEK